MAGGTLLSEEDRYNVELSQPKPSHLVVPAPVARKAAEPVPLHLRTTCPLKVLHLVLEVNILYIYICTHICVYMCL